MMPFAISIYQATPVKSELREGKCKLDFFTILDNTT